MKIRRLSFKELVAENKKSLLMDKEAMEEIDKRIEERALRHAQKLNSVE